MPPRGVVSAEAAVEPGHSNSGLHELRPQLYSAGEREMSLIEASRCFEFISQPELRIRRLRKPGSGLAGRCQRQIRPSEAVRTCGSLLGSSTGITPVAELASAQWLYKSRSSEREDSPFGVFMEGRRWHLQPDDVRADFTGEGASLEVSLRGTFLLFDSHDTRAPGRRVLVSGTFPALVQTRARKPSN